MSDLDAWFTTPMLALYAFVAFMGVLSPRAAFAGLTAGFLFPLLVLLLERHLQ